MGVVMMKRLGFAGILEVKRTKPLEGDFYGTDGLLHCGVCHEPKEIVQKMPEGLRDKLGETRIFPRQCACMRHDDEEHRRIEAEKAAAVKIDKAKRACFPYHAMWDMDFAHDDGSNPQVTEFIRRYCKAFDAFKAKGAGLLFHGPVGTGKSFHAAQVANALIEQGYRVLYTSLSSLGARMQKSYGKDDVLGDICSYDCVILDDLGAERTTQTMNEYVFQIINALYASETVMVFTTNLEMHQIAQSQDPDYQRIYSRILGRCKPVEVRGGDKRKSKSAEIGQLFRDLE